MIPYCQHQVRAEDHAAVSKVLASERLTQGPVGRAFEAGLCERVGAAHALVVSSGTSALSIALQALGVGPGDEVLVPSLTFLATANTVSMTGATPVFVDVDPKTLALDLDALEARINVRTRGAILVHYAGHAADAAGCRARLGPNRFLLEDACHALGAERANRWVGADSDAACFSFHPAKHITTGEGGAILTRSAELAMICRRLREHGVERDASRFRGLGLPAEIAAEESGNWIYEMHALSGNHRLSDLGASLGLSQLSRIEEILSARRARAIRYAEAFSDCEWLTPLAEEPGTRSAWHLYPIQLDVDRIDGGRAAVYADLHAQGIGVQVHYIPIHLQPYYRTRIGTRYGDLPHTEAAYLRLLSLPMYADLSEVEQERVLDVLFDVVGKRLR